MVYSNEDFSDLEDGFHTITGYSQDTQGPFDSLEEAIQATEDYFDFQGDDAEAQDILLILDGKCIKSYEEEDVDKWVEQIPS